MPPSVLLTPPCLLFDPGEDHGAALKVAGSERDTADVVREEGAVGADPGEFAVELRKTLEGGIEVVHVDIRREPVQLVDGAGQRRTRSAEQVGQRGGSVVE